MIGWKICHQSNGNELSRSLINNIVLVALVWRVNSGENYPCKYMSDLLQATHCQRLIVNLPTLSAHKSRYIINGLAEDACGRCQKHAISYHNHIKANVAIMTP